MVSIPSPSWQRAHEDSATHFQYPRQILDCAPPKEELGKTHCQTVWLSDFDIVTLTQLIILPWRWWQQISPKLWYIYIYIKVKVMRSRYWPGVAQRVGRGIALLFHDRGTRRGWVVSSTPWAHFTPGKDPVPILQEAGWAPGPVWTGGKISSPPGFDPGPSSP